MTPLADHLVPNACNPPSFSNLPSPTVLDFSLDDLGMSEGLTQAGYTIQAGLGLDVEYHQSWMVGNNSQDGPPLTDYTGPELSHRRV